MEVYYKRIWYFNANRKLFKSIWRWRKLWKKGE